MRATRDINTPAVSRWDLRSLFLNFCDYCSGVAGELLGTLLSIENSAESAQCFSSIGEAAADQRRRNVRLLLHGVGERDIGGRRVDIEHQVRRELYDIFEIDRVAAPGEPTQFR
jgi:hypothetical protein